MKKFLIVFMLTFFYVFNCCCTVNANESFNPDDVTVFRSGFDDDIFTNDVSDENYGTEEEYIPAGKADTLISENRKSTIAPLGLFGYTSKYNKDSFENNNSFSAAYNKGTLNVNGGSILTTNMYGNIHDTGKNYLTDKNDRDVDYYKFEVLENYRFEIKLSNIPSGLDYDLELYKVHKKVWPLPWDYEKLRGSYNGAGRDEIIDYYVKDGVTKPYIDKSTYIVKVYSYKGVSNEKYKLSISLRPLEDIYEYNDSYENSTPITSQYINSQFRKFDTSIQATLHSKNDIDYFKFNLYRDYANIKISLSNIPQGRDYNISLYDSGHNYIAGSANSSNKDEYIYKNLTKGTYYIPIYPYDGYSIDKHYNLTVKGVDYNNYTLGDGIAVWRRNNDLSDNACQSNISGTLCSSDTSQIYVSYASISYFNSIIDEYGIDQLNDIIEFMFLNNEMTLLQGLAFSGAGFIVSQGVGFTVGGLFADIVYVFNKLDELDGNEITKIYNEALLYDKGVLITNWRNIGGGSVIEKSEYTLIDDDVVSSYLYRDTNFTDQYGDITIFPKSSLKTLLEPHLRK